MSAYKFFVDGKIVYASNVFYYWHERYRQPFGCITPEDVAQKANLIQVKDGVFLHPTWLHPLPESAASLFPDTDAAVEIDDAEYAELRELLDEDGEVTPEPEPDPDPGEPGPPEEPPVMTIQEMREAILELQKNSGASGNYATEEDVQAVWDSMAAAYQEGVESA